MTGITLGSRVRVAACDPRSDEPRYAGDGVAEVIHASIAENGRVGFDLRYDLPGREPRYGYCEHAAWLVPAGIPRDPDGYVIEDTVPGQLAMTVANFTASLATFGAAWSGDTRETSAWHSEEPGRSGGWDPPGRPVRFSLSVRLAMTGGTA